MLIASSEGSLWSLPSVPSTEVTARFGGSSESAEGRVIAPAVSVDMPVIQGVGSLSVEGSAVAL